jgi:hypothetical protein
VLAHEEAVRWYEQADQAPGLPPEDRTDLLIALGSARLGAGDRAAARRAFLRAAELAAELPSEALTLHVCLSDDSGITVLNGCPTRSELESFAASPEFADALAAAGLPTPVPRPVGEVHHALINTAPDDQVAQ